MENKKYGVLSMKICWDNLERLRYNKNTSRWKNIENKNFYLYKEKCQNCQEPFLSTKKSGKFCSIDCLNNGKSYPKDHHKKIGIKNKGKLKGDKHHQWKGGVSYKNIAYYDTYFKRLSYAEKIRKNKYKGIIEVKCTYCGKWYIPSMNSVIKRIQSINGERNGEGRFYCSEECKKECSIYNTHKYPKGFRQASSREVQPELRRLVFEKDNWTCQKCNSKKSLHCHHIEGIRWEPLESTDIDKCVTYCKDCHKEVHLIEGCKYYEMKCEEVYFATSKTNYGI